MRTASGEYEKVRGLQQQVDTIPQKIEAWGRLYQDWTRPSGESQPKPDADRFWQEVDAYIELRKGRDELGRILGVYETVVAACTPPEVNEDWMTEMERMGIDVGPIREAYQKLFTTDLGQLRGQAAEIRRLYERAVKDLLILRAAGDPLARVIDTTASDAGVGTALFTAVSAGLNAVSTRTPSFTAAVQRRVAQKAASS